MLSLRSDIYLLLHTVSYLLNACSKVIRYKSEYILIIVSSIATKGLMAVQFNDFL